jgi:hypothetical protein
MATKPVSLLRIVIPPLVKYVLILYPLINRVSVMIRMYLSVAVQAVHVRLMLIVFLVPVYSLIHVRRLVILLQLVAVVQVVSVVWVQRV